MVSRSPACNRKPVALLLLPQQAITNELRKTCAARLRLHSKTFTGSDAVFIEI